MIDEIQKTGLPWLSESLINQKLTLKIEVSFKGKLLVIRFLHLDKFFTVEYPKIALRIAHNTIQTEYLRKEYHKYGQSSILQNHESYFCLEPKPNWICSILSDLGSFTVHQRDLPQLLSQ